VLPSGGIEVIGNEINRIAAQQNSTLGLDIPDRIGGVGVERECRIKRSWTAQSCFRRGRKRGFFRLNAVSLAFTAGAILFVLVAIAAMVVVPLALQISACRIRRRSW